MNVRDDIQGKFIVNGRPVTVRLINNPTIDDVLISEARVHATAIERGSIDTNRRVPRDLRDFLIRLGVER